MVIKVRRGKQEKNEFVFVVLEQWQWQNDVVQ